MCILSNLVNHLQIDDRHIRSTPLVSMKTLPTTPLSRSPSQLFPVAMSSTPVSHVDSVRAAESWLRHADKPDRIATQDLRSCLRDISVAPSTSEQDQIAYILVSDELRDWMRATNPTGSGRQARAGHRGPGVQRGILRLDGPRPGPCGRHLLAGADAFLHRPRDRSRCRHFRRWQGRLDLSGRTARRAVVLSKATRQLTHIPRPGLSHRRQARQVQPRVGQRLKAPRSPRETSRAPPRRLEDSVACP